MDCLDLTEEQDRGERLVLGAGRHLAMDGQMRQIVPDHGGVDAGLRLTLPFSRVGQEEAHPVDVAALSAVGIVSHSEPPAEFLEGSQRLRAAVGVDDGAGRLLMPVGPLKEVDEVDAQGLFGLPDLPVLASRLVFEVFAEGADPSGQGVVGCGSHQEAAHPADAVGGGLRGDQPGLQQELADS